MILIISGFLDRLEEFDFKQTEVNLDIMFFQVCCQRREDGVLSFWVGSAPAQPHGFLLEPRPLNIRK